MSESSSIFNKGPSPFLDSAKGAFRILNSCFNMSCSLSSFCLSLSTELLIPSRSTWRGSGLCWSFSLSARKKMMSCSRLVRIFLSLCDMIPFSSFTETLSSTLHASVAKSRSFTSLGFTAEMAKASLSSFIGAQPTFSITRSIHKNNNKKIGEKNIM